MNEMTNLERTVIAKLIIGDGDSSKIMNKQIELAKVVSREFTGSGFITEFIIDPPWPKLKGNPTIKLGDVDGEADNIEFGIGFLLYIDDGLIRALEGYTYDEPWPNEITNLKLSYSREPRTLDDALRL